MEAKLIRRQHALDRYRLHYNHELTKRCYRSLCRAIRKHLPDRSSQYVKFLLPDAERIQITHWALWIHRRWVPVIFNSDIGRITTFLPAYQLDKARYYEAARRHGLLVSGPNPATYNLAELVNKAVGRIIISD